MKKSLDSIMKNEYGSATLMITVIMSSLATMIVAFSAASNVSRSASHSTNVLNNINTLKENIYNQMTHDLIWRKTILDATNAARAGGKIGCLGGNDANLDCREAQGNLRLIDADGLVYYDPWVDGEGFDHFGQKCVGSPSNIDEEGNTTFGTEAYVGNNNCPINVKISWKSICLNGIEKCESPNNQIRADFEFSFESGSGRQLRFSSEAFSFILERQSTHP